MTLHLIGTPPREVIERTRNYHYLSNLAICNDNGAAVGARIIELQFKDCGPFSDAASYTLAMPDSLAADGDGLDILIPI